MMIDFWGTVAGDILSSLGLKANSPLEDIFAEKNTGPRSEWGAVR